MSGVPRRRRTGRAVAIVAVLAVGATAVAASGTGLLPSFAWNDDGGGEVASQLPPATAKVTRETLVERQTESGVVSHGDAMTVSVRTAGTVTWLAAVDSVVARGKALYRLDDEAVVLLYGALPSYRSLAEGVEGADVQQFERNLYALGYRGFTVDDEFTDNTAAAVEEWQDDLGLEETGTVELGSVVYAAKAVRIDSREIAVGDAVQPGAAVLGYTDTTPVAVAELDVSDQRLAAEGAAVEVTLPDGTKVAGKVTEARTVIENSDSENDRGDSDTETKLEVTIALRNAEALARFDQASVELGFTASRRANVLTVPVAALLALAEGGYGVEVVEGGTSRIVAVQTGLFANGRVEVSGTGLAEGVTIGVPT